MRSYRGKQNYVAGSVVFFLSLLSVLCHGQKAEKKEFATFDTNTIPPQPSRDEWYFVEDLKSPFWDKISWSRSVPRAGQADLRRGLSLKTVFPDRNNRLAPAYEDLARFCAAAGISFPNGGYQLQIELDTALSGEEFRLDVGVGHARLFAGHADGVRRGIFYIEDEMLTQKGPFLSTGMVFKKPAIKRRISRCFFSPIKRPGNSPGVGDELLDDIDYYPDEYLNRLAHEGVNGLWLTVSSKDGEEKSVGFGDLVSTSITPNKGLEGEKRLAKLKSIVDKCLRYGIRIYIKTMEPHVRFSKDDPILKKFPDLAGNLVRDHYFLCASGEAGQQYLYEAVNKIFAAVPELGGIINISHGELYTTCLSALPATGGGKITCPRCSRMPEWKILYHSLTAMKKGMEEISPDAELISWLYMPEPQAQSSNSANELADWVYEIPSHTPEGVILQFNFESGVEKEVYGKTLIGGDYWISAPGPSERFVNIAKSAAAKNTPVSAKIQTGTSYEVSTVPYVPVPSLLYQKFHAMRTLGVSHTMLNWIVGASPGLMNKAAGLLSSNEYSDENEFLRHLALIYWKEEDAQKIVKAWGFFRDGYQNYPLTNLFQYYGPINDGVAWPLLLYPHDAVLAPTYQLGSRNTLKTWAPSGDRIGESFTELLSLEEVTELCRLMTESWDKGLLIFDQLEGNYSGDKARLLDIGIAKSLGIQFKTGYNILKFYLLREEMFRTDSRKSRLILNQLIQIIKEEIESTQKLIVLCEKDARLGFHADAEGYKFYPEKLRWRISQLRHTLDQDVTRISEMIERGSPLFPSYTGKIPAKGSAYVASTTKTPVEIEKYRLKSSKGRVAVDWSAHSDAENLYLRLYTQKQADSSQIQNVSVKIETARLFQAKDFRFAASDITMHDGVSESYGEISIPLEQIDRVGSGEKKPLRMNLSVRIGQDDYFWKIPNPIAPRLMLGSANPADLEWLFFQK